MLLALLVSLAAPVAPAAAGPVYSGRHSQLRIAVPRIEATGTIDGSLDEPAWAAAARLTDFSLYSPVDGAPAEDATEVLVWYSPSAIHFGIRALAAPHTVRATLASRDRIESDDSVKIFLSTYNDGRQAFVFEVNPLGVQADGTLVEGARATSGGFFDSLQSGREGTDLSADYVFDSRGRLTADGYTVEVRIPFKTLRYQSAPSQDWGLNVIRLVQSRGHEQSWTPARREGNSFLAQSGTLVGLTGLRPGLVLDLNPVVTARMEGTPAPSEQWNYDAHRPEIGGNVRWGVTPNLTLNGTVNPDFSQVEADAGQFTFDPRSASFFPEKRPFFLDGIEQFTTPNRLIYTRRIVAPLFAAKLTGKVSGTGLAFLSALDDPATSATGDDRPFFNLLRVQRDLGGQSRVGLVYTDKIDGGYSNRVAALDARIAFADLYTVELQAAASRTRDGVTTTGPLWEATFDRNGRRFGLRYDLTGMDEDFRADAGFIARPAIAVASLDHRLSWFGAQGAVVERFSTDVVLNGVWRYRDFVSGGQALERKLHLNNNANLRGGWKAGASVLIEEFRYDEDLYADYALLDTTDAGTEILPFVGTPAIQNLDWVLTLDTPQFRTFSGSLFLLWGRDENFFEWSPADIVYATVTADWRPTEQIRASAGYQLQQFKRRSDGTTVGRRQIPRLKVEYQLSRSIFFRVVGEYDTSLQDDLRDDTRTELPIAIRNEAGVYERALGFETGRLRVDWLFSYQPNPGTVVFAGYGSTHAEPEGRRYGGLRRAADGFFVKVSYLFRL
jgi:hypothetical protein